MMRWISSLGLLFKGYGWFRTSAWSGWTFVREARLFNTISCFVGYFLGDGPGRFPIWLISSVYSMSRGRKKSYGPWWEPRMLSATLPPRRLCLFDNKTLPAKRLTVNVDRSEGAINEKLEGRRKVFVGLVFARRRNALLKLLDRDLAVLQEGKRKWYPALLAYSTNFPSSLSKHGC